MGWTFYNSNGEALVQHAESEATKAEMEAETAGAKFVPPDLVRNSPGVAKAWVRWEQTGALPEAVGPSVDFEPVSGPKKLQKRAHWRYPQH